MKNTFKHLLVTGLLATMAISCGGGDKSGGGGSSPFVSQYQGTMTPQDSEAMARIASWYGNESIATIPNFQGFSKVARTITTQSYTGSTSCPGEIKTIWIFEVCIVTSTTSGTTTNGTATTYRMRKEVTGNLIYCPFNTSTGSCVGMEMVYDRSTNAELVAAMSGNNNTLKLLNITQMGSIYQLNYGYSTLNTQPTVSYKIDTSLPTIMNPVEVTNLSSGTQNYLQSLF